MGKVIGYMVTWTTYGTWLQGSERGFVKDGVVCGASPGLKDSNRARLVGRKFVLTKVNGEIVRKAIADEAVWLGQRVYAMSVAATHVHMVVDAIDETIETAVARYKLAALKALRVKGIKGKVWTRGYDKRFCFDEAAVKSRVEYVERHGWV